MTRIVAFSIALLMLPFAVHGQNEGEIEATRSDLASAYLRLELALKDVSMDDETAARVNKGFDRATMRFFAKQFGPAIKAINDTTASLDASMDADALAAASLRTTIDPAVYISGTRIVPELHVEMLYDSPVGDGDHGLKADVVLVSADGTVAHRLMAVDATLGPNRTFGVSETLDEAARGLAPGRYDIGLETAAGKFIAHSQWSVVPKSLDVISAANKAPFVDLRMVDDTMEQAISTLFARNALLTDNPSTENSAEFLFDPNVLAAEVAAEREMLARKRNKVNPYMGRTGDYWRVVKPKGKKDIPIRVYLPETVDASKAYPLVIVFHGAGGDENMFMDAYGAGKIKELADEHGFLVVSPLTYSFSGDSMGPNFDLMLDVITKNYNVDGSRIYVVGHSMGGGATSHLVNLRGGMLAAAVPICGFREITADPANLPPIRAYAASLDPIVAPARIKPAVDKSAEAGVNIEYKLIENWGHTLTVGEVLPEAVEWMLQYSRD